jgi:hypothetical protein
MADKTDTQVICEWLAADKVQIKVILYMTVGAGIVLDTERKLTNHLYVDSLSD